MKRNVIVVKLYINLFLVSPKSNRIISLENGFSPKTRTGYTIKNYGSPREDGSYMNTINTLSSTTGASSYYTNTLSGFDYTDLHSK